MYVLMVVPSDFPDGDAGAVRDDAFAHIYRELGYDVRLVGKSTTSRYGQYNGTDYVSIYKDVPGIRGHFERFFFEHKEYENVINLWIKEFGIPSIIHINSIPEKTISFLIHIAEENNIPIVHDSVEWYSACEFPHGKLDKAYILKDRLNRKIIRDPIRVYSISSFLDDHFKARGLRSCRIPVIMDVQNTVIGTSDADDKVKLIYAGSPATKDYLKEMVLGVEMLSEEEKQKVLFNIYGATEEQIKSITGLSKLSTCIVPHGRVPRSIVQEQLLKSDFSVLLRPAEERYAKAGFPTKSVEAMSHGVAMMCNLSSDLGMYLVDGENAIIVDGYNENAFLQGLKRIIRLNRNEINSLKKRARELADNCFDYRIWNEKIKSFLR